MSDEKEVIIDQSYVDLEVDGLEQWKARLKEDKEFREAVENGEDVTI